MSICTRVVIVPSKVYEILIPQISEYNADANYQFKMQISQLTSFTPIIYLMLMLFTLFHKYIFKNTTISFTFHHI